MKFTHKLTILIFLLVVSSSVANYFLLSRTFQKFQTKRLEAVEVVSTEKFAETIYRLVVEEQTEKITAALFQERSLNNEKIEYMIVTDADDNIISHTFLSETPLQGANIVHQHSLANPTHIEIVNSDYFDVYNISTPIFEGIIQIGTLYTGIKNSYLVDSSSLLRTASTTIIIIASCSVMFGLVFAFALSYAATRSISSLQLVADKISQGDYDTKVEITSKDEIGSLAKSFSRMQKSIQHAKQKLEAHNLNLEHIVQERTKKLEEQNKKILLHHEELQDLNHNLVQNAEQMRAFLSAVSYPLYVINLDYTLAMMNDATKNLIASSGGSGETCKSLHSNGNCNIDDNECPFHKVLKTGKPASAEHTIIEQGKEEKYIEVCAYPIFDDSGKVIQVVESYQDVTEKKLAEIEHRQLESELHRAQKLESIGTLAAGISHEINTPIQFIGDNIRFAIEGVNDFTSIIKNLQNKIKAKALENDTYADIHKQCDAILEDGDFEYLVEELPQALKQTSEGVEHVSKIVLAMKEFSHIGSNDVKQGADINKAIESTVTISKNEWKYLAKIELQLEDNLPFVLCLIGDIKQVFLNVLVNAAHAIGESNNADKENEHNSRLGLIKITTKQNDDWIDISIQDNGSGIPEEHRDKIFDPFFTSKDVGKGTGQGLNLAYNIVTEKHGGKIWFETVIGEGTTFFISLPVNNS